MDEMMNVPITLREWDWDKLFETTLKTQDEMEMEMREGVRSAWACSEERDARG